MPFYFFLALLIGFLLVYILSPKPDIVIKNPNPDNTDNTYIDDNNVCYKYKSKKVNCPIDKNINMIKF